MSLPLVPRPIIKLIINNSKPQAHLTSINTNPDIIITPFSVPEITPANHIHRNRRSTNTTRAYGYDWGLFLSYCRTLYPEPHFHDLNHNHVWFHLQHMQLHGLKYSTIERRLAGIMYHLPFLDVDAPLATPLDHTTIKLQMEGLRRTISTRKEGQQPILNDKLHQMIEVVGWNDTCRQLQDRTLLLITWHACLRREESCSLTWNDIEEKEILNDQGQKNLGLLIHVRKSKTDQTCKGIDKAIVPRKDVYCPVKHLLAWKARLGAKALCGERLMAKIKSRNGP
jgi:integrase